MEQCLESYMQLMDSDSNWPVLSTIKYSSNEGQQAYQYEVVPFINNQSIKELTNLGLIELYLRTKKESVWQEFYSRIDPYVRTYITKVLRSYEKIILLTQQDFVSLREDLVQEVYLKLLNNNCRVLRLYSSNDSNSVFYSYLHRVTTNLVINYFRQYKKQKRQATVLSLEDVWSKASVSKNSKHYKHIYYQVSTDNVFEVKEMINKALSTRENKRNKQIFFSFMILGMTIKEINKLPGFEHMTQECIESVIRKLKKQIVQFSVTYLTTSEKKPHKTQSSINSYAKSIN